MAKVLLKKVPRFEKNFKVLQGVEVLKKIFKIPQRGYHFKGKNIFKVPALKKKEKNSKFLDFT